MIIGLGIGVSFSGNFDAIGSTLGSSEFFAPLKSSLDLTRGTGTATFTRATTATVMGYAPDAVSGASQVLLNVASGEARFSGARRVSQGVWSETLSDATPIPDATLKGYLAEAAATNLCLQSNAFTTTWVNANTSSTQNATGITGTANEAWTLLCSATTSNHILYQAGVPVTATTQTISFFLKAGTYNFAYINLQCDIAQRFVTRVFDLSDGTLGESIVGTTSGTLIDSSCTSIGNGWYRCQVTYNVTFSGGTFAVIGICPLKTGNTFSTYGDVSFTGAGTETVIIQGAQVESNAFATSYIPTTTVAVTRNADVLTYQTASNFSDTAGAMYAETIQTAWANVSGSIIGSATQGLMPLATNSGVKGFDGTNTVNGPTGTPTGTMKMGATWGGSAMSVDANGGTVSTGAYDGAWNLTSIGIGTSGNGNIRNARVWQTQLSDPILKGITT